MGTGNKVNGKPKPKAVPRKKQVPVGRPKMRPDMPMAWLNRAARGTPSTVRVRGRATGKLWHPALSAKSWVPRPLKMTPTLRVRDIAIFQITATAANRISLICQPCFVINVAPHSFSTICAVSGSTSVAPAAYSTYVPRNLVNFSTAARIRLHRMALTVTCLGPTAVGVLVPSTYVRIGLVRAPINTSVLTSVQIADYIEGRSGLHLYSANNLMYEPTTYASCPIDWTGWSEFRDFADSSTTLASELEPTGTLAPICAVFSASASLDAYACNLHLEYDVLPCDGVTSSGFSTSGVVHHPTMAAEVAETGAAALLAAGGFIARGVTAVGGDIAAEAGPAIVAAAL